MIINEAWNKGARVLLGTLRKGQWFTPMQGENLRHDGSHSAHRGVVKVIDARGERDVMAERADVVPVGQVSP